MAVQSKYSTIAIMILVALMIVCSGSVGSVTDHGQFAATSMSAPHITIDNAVLALYVNAESQAYYVPFTPRARDQLFLNENRNAILRFIQENPGSRLYDVAKFADINLGTARYHLMILTLNHVIVPYNDGSKHIRYFTNNGTYTNEQMKAISLLKREPISKLMNALAGKEGMTNSKISAASGLSYSEVNRYLKELIAKGAVVKEPLSPEKYQYRIVPAIEQCLSGSSSQNID